MKKIYLLLIAVAGVLTAASCAKELVDDSAQVNPGEVTTLTLSFDKTAKTALIDGKTTWLAGDVIRIYNASGKYYQDVTVPDEDTGKADIEVEVKMSDSKYFAIYPVDAANGIDSGKPSIKISGNPDGRFASANISAAETPVNGTELRMRNVTAVLAIDVESNNTVEMVQVNAQNAMTGTYSVDLSGESPVLTAKSATKSATIATGAVDGTYYIAVAPGTYAEDFSVTALKGNGGYQTLTSTKSNEVAVNTILKLGKIGDNLTSGLPGEGTESNPYKISNLGAWTAFSASVNLGNSYEGKYISLETDIEEPVKTPVGYYIAADVQSPFAGFFSGNNHTVTIDLDSENCKSANYVALFGVVDAGAVVKDMNVKGTVVSTGNYAGGLVAYTRGTTDNPVEITNCSSNVSITSTGNYVAGISGYATNATISGCRNTGAVVGINNVAGIVGRAAYATVKSCVNSAPVESKATAATLIYYSYNNKSQSGGSGSYDCATGGIAGFANNSSVEDSSNSADVSAFFKAGGVVGATYWTPVTRCRNSGNVSGSGDVTVNIASQTGLGFGSVVGGIVGWLYTQGHITDCHNTGKITGKGGLGGIVGYANSTSNASSVPNISKCSNTGDVVATGSLIGGTDKQLSPAVGGICGTALSWGTKSPTILECTNSGKVITDGVNAGGVVGRLHSGTTNATMTVKNSSNSGNVEAKYWAGGICGVSFSIFKATHSIFNCSNTGSVTGTRTDDSGECAGGILGANGVKQTSYQNITTLTNCYNHGDVLYRTVDHLKPYTGGIAGRMVSAAGVKNCYNTGFVGPEGKVTPAVGATARLGALAGSLEVANGIDFSYYKEGVCDNVIGTSSSASTGTTVSSFNDTFTFGSIVTVNGSDCETLLEALNAWVGTSTTYYLWKAGAKGPEFDIK